MLPTKISLKFECIGCCNFALEALFVHCGVLRSFVVLALVLRVRRVLVFLCHFDHEESRQEDS